MLDLAATVLTAEAADHRRTPCRRLFGGAHGGALAHLPRLTWSGSRAMSVFIEAITIAYGSPALRGYLRRRLSRVVALRAPGCAGRAPGTVAGPTHPRPAPRSRHLLHLGYWPLVGLLSPRQHVALLHLSVPVRTSLVRQLPGAIAVLILLYGTVGLRLYPKPPDR